MSKKMIKKTGAAVLTMALLVSMGAMALPVNATAGDALTVKVSDVNCGTTKVAVTGVTVYQVAKFSNTTGKWAWNAPFTNSTTFASLNTMDATQLNALAKSLKAVTNDSTKAEALAKTVVSGSATDTAEGYQVTLASVTGGADVTGQGYYLIVPTVSDNETVVQPTLMPIDSTGEAFTNVKPKANPLPLVKKITATNAGEKSQSGDSDTSVGIVGSTVEYKITSQLPEYASNVAANKIKPYVITDDPSTGIKINNDEFGANGSNVVVMIGTQDKTDAVTIAKEGDGFKVTVGGDLVKANMGADVTITFKATITEAAVTGAGTVSDYQTAHQGKTGNPNTAKLTWGNNFATGGYADPDDPDNPDEPEEPPVEKKSTVTTYVGAVTLLKQGNKTGTVENLQGAVFTLEGTNYATKTGLTTNANGKIDFGYLPAGTYTLTETAAPTGYQTIGSTYQFTVTNKANGSTEFTTYEVAEETQSSEVEMTLTGNNAKAQITVTDPPADTLPATGGIGTYLFTIGGAAVVLMAGVMFVIYMKKRKTEE